MAEVYHMLEYAINVNTDLQKQVTELNSTITELRNENATWVSDIERLEAQAVELRKEITAKKRNTDGANKVLEKYRNIFGSDIKNKKGR